MTSGAYNGAHPARLIARTCRRAKGPERNTASVRSRTATLRRDANPAPPPHELRGRWLTLARITWLTVVLVTAVILVASLPAYFSVLHDVCHSHACIGGQLSLEETRALGDLGLPTGFYAAYVLTLDLLVVVGFCSVGAIIFWRRSRERAALFASLALVMFGLTWPGAFETARRFPGWGEPAHEPFSIPERIDPEPGTGRPLALDERRSALGSVGLEKPRPTARTGTRR